MDLKIKGRRALVMGGSKGLGKAIAAALVGEGVSVAICARHADQVEASAREIGAVGIACDLSAPGAATAVVRDAATRLGGIDILIVNTGGPPAGPFQAFDDSAWRSAFESLWMSSVGAIRAALPGMQERRWGRVVLVTSIAAKEPVANLMLSNSLRAGLHGLVNALSREVARDGITVNALMPGYTLTERLAALRVDEAKLKAQIPAGRIGDAADFGAAAAFLSSEPAGYLTGQAIAVDGGLMQSI